MKQSTEELNRRITRILDLPSGELHRRGRRLILDATARWLEEPVGVDEITFAVASVLSVFQNEELTVEDQGHIIAAACRGMFQLGYEQRKRDEIIELAGKEG